MTVDPPDPIVSAAAATVVLADAPESVPRTARANVAAVELTPTALPEAASSTRQATVVEAQLLPAAPASPVTVVSRMVSEFLTMVGLGPTATDTPAAPVQSPLWGLLEWARRQLRHTFFNQTPTVDYHPADNSQSQDGVITGDLHAVDPDGDPLTFTVTRAPEHGSVVVNRDGTFTYTPDADFTRIGSDTFTITVDDGAAYRLSGPVGLIQRALHVGAQLLGLAGSDAVDSHPDVKVTPTVFIDVGSQPADVAVSPDGATAYVVNQVDETVSVIDTATNTVTHTVTVGENPVAVAVSPNGSRVYVTNRFDDTVSVIDTAANAVIGTIAVGFLPSGLALSPSGTILYVANSQDQTVMKINTSTQTVLATISVSGFPDGVAVSPDGTRVYVTCEGVGGQQAVGTLAVIETTNNTVIGAIDVGEFSPQDVAVSPDGSMVYVANGSSTNTVRVIDTVSMSVIATVTVGAGPNGLAVSPDGKRVYVTNFSDDTVSVIGTVSNTVTSTIAVGNSPRGVAVSSDGDRIFVANSADGTLFIRG
jgi:YVTN family beta-propeller protein